MKYFCRCWNVFCQFVTSTVLLALFALLFLDIDLLSNRWIVGCLLGAALGTAAVSILAHQFRRW